MALHTTFGELLTMLRAECRLSTNPAVGPDANTRHKVVLNRAYEMLWKAVDWPHLKYTSPLASLSAGQRYYSFPAGMDHKHLDEVVVWWNGEPYPLDPGIGFEEYAAFDSNADERAEPPQRYAIRQQSDALIQYEVWPLPVGNDLQIQFRGRKAFRKLVNPIDICLLDDNLVVLTAAADVLRPINKDDADSKARAAQQMLGVERAAHAQPHTGGTNVPTIGTDAPRLSLRNGRATVVVGRGS